MSNDGISLCTGSWDSLVSSPFACGSKLVGHLSTNDHYSSKSGPTKRCNVITGAATVWIIDPKARFGPQHCAQQTIPIHPSFGNPHSMMLIEPCEDWRTQDELTKLPPPPLPPPRTFSEYTTSCFLTTQSTTIPNVYARRLIAQSCPSVQPRGRCTCRCDTSFPFLFVSFTYTLFLSDQ